MASDEFYTGFVADHYDALVPEDEAKSYAFFRCAIEQGGQPALELACGTGRPLLSFAAAGLDVEGLDSSADMLARCRDKARHLGVSVPLHCQRMESFAIDRVFRTIYCVSSSFMLLPDDDTVERALSTLLRHLEPGGRLLVALHVPTELEAPSPDWRVAREAALVDGTVVRCLAKLARVDHLARTTETVFRYESIVDGAVGHHEERTFRLHWHTQAGFAERLRTAGYADPQSFRANGKPSQPTDRVFIVSASRP